MHAPRPLSTRPPLRRGASRTIPLALLAFVMIGAGIAIMVFRGRTPAAPAGTAPLPPGLVVEDLLETQEESGTGMVIQITDADDPTLLTAEILAERYDPDGPTIRLVEQPEAWLFGTDGSAWYIRADRGRFYIPEGEQNPREGTLTGGVTARRFEPRAPDDDLRFDRPDPAADAPALVATTDEPLRFNLDLLTFETDGRLAITTDSIDFAGRGAFVVLNEQRESITELRVDEGERIVYTPLASEPAPTDQGRPVAAATPDPGTVAAATPAPSPTGSPDATGDAAATAAGPTPPAAKIDYYEIVFADDVRGVTGTQVIESDELTIWTRLIDNEIPGGTSRTQAVAPRSPIEAALVAALAAQDTAQSPADEPAPGDAAPGSARPDPVAPAASPQTVTLTWTGPLTVQPLADEPERLTLGDDLALRFEATDGAVEIRDEASGATATALAANYFTGRERAELEGRGGSIVLASPEAGRISGMNTVEMELATGLVTIPTAGELYGVDHTEESPQSILWTENAAFTFVVADGRMTDRLETAAFRGAIVGRSRDAEIRGDALVARFDTPEGSAPRLRRVDVDRAIASDGRDAGLTGDELTVLFDEGTRGEDLDPTRAVITGNAVARRDNGASIRADWIDARLGRDADGDIGVTTTLARGAVAFDDGAGVLGRGETLRADTLAEFVVITGPAGSDDAGEPRTWVSRDGTRIAGPDIRLSAADRTAEVFGPGSFSRAGADDAPDDRSLDASWTGRMAFDDRAGTVLCLGGVEAESPGPDGSTDSVLGDRLTITLAPLNDDDAAPEGDRLRFAEVFGSPGTPARVESRRHAPPDPASDAPDGERAIEALYRLDATRIRFAAADDRVEVPVAGRLFVLDRRPRDDTPTDDGTGDASGDGADASPLAAPGGGRGTTLVEWAGSMDFDRVAGRAVCRDEARIANKPIGADRLSEVVADTITASFATSGSATASSGDLRWAIAEGDALLRNEDRREILADRLIYSPEDGTVQALGENGRRVEITDLTRGTTTNARAIIWELASDRLTITNPGAIVSPE